MVSISKEKKDYYLMKIRLLEAFIAASDDPKQKEIYEGYRQSFLDKLSKKDNPDIIAEKAALKAAKAEELAEKKLIAKEAKELEIEEAERINEEKEAKKAEVLKQIADLKKKLPEEEGTTIIAIEEVPEEDEPESESEDSINS